MEERSLDSLISAVKEREPDREIREFSDFRSAPSFEPDPQQRVGGWLIVVCLALLFTAGRLGLLVVKDILPVFNAETWSALTTPGSAAYHANWGPVLIAEAAGNSFFALFALILLVLLLLRKFYLPALMVIFYLLNFLFVVGDYFAATSIPFIAEQPQAESIREIVAAFVNVTIWVPYFLVSERVKKTFLR